MSYSSRLLNCIQRSQLLPGRMRRTIVRMMGAEVARDCFINAGVTIVGRRLALEPQAFVNQGVVIEAVGAEVRIGAGAHVAHNVLLVTSTHETGGPGRRAGAPAFRPIAIEAGCWIGAGAIVLPGVRIARGCIVGAGAVVTRDTEPDGIYAGVPARRTRDLPVA